MKTVGQSLIEFFGLTDMKGVVAPDKKVPFTISSEKQRWKEGK